ncbi:ferritin-like domain-containing protein [Sinimarinibacterium sp. CAU 1509]|uniref:ferritin-like domain-containing protein n=1 Tax=Sinimarinibacterium sp. CAU 1509 TaxID=2562283 RepID=UPI0010ABF0D9|nr:ferritin-like domain-containing protein [Sinimarinibacterium sp. CAU 1509]TJY62250.1 ferritin-like domain-containing protein [Sinimarinibacterium sp. CAU 1509]
MSDWRAAAFAALIEPDPARKCQRVADLTVDAGPAPSLAFEWTRVPGRPEQPLLVSPRDVPTRGLGSVAGRAALAHAVAHIEFNAINLALDAACRFDGLPLPFYRDWISVAQDEARHFQMVQQRLDALGSHYGALTAHNGLWEAAEKTAHDVLVRMALVPRVLEARGLDVTPGMIGRLREVGDLDTVAVLDVILAEELRHVAIGTHWFRYLCEQRGLSSTETFKGLLAEHNIHLRPPLNLPARYAAGFVEGELG